MLLRGVDRASFATAFAVRLRQQSVPVGLTGIEDFTRALVASPPDSKSRLYWTARIALVRRRSELAAFDAVFEAVFANATFSIDPHARRAQGQSPVREDALVSVPSVAAAPTPGDGLPWATLPPVVSTSEDSDSDTNVPERLPSELQGLADLPFEQLTEREMELLGRWLEAAFRTWPHRRSRRRAPGPGGRHVALRPTIARSRRTGWEPIELVRVRPVPKPRRVVMLCDVSQSMQPQIAAYFHLMRALTLVAGGEAFAFATSLTRLTSVLRNKSTTMATEQATERVTDRFGGTRIAASVSALLASHHGNAVRGGIVVIGSDGWDSEPPQQMAVAMARLHRRAHRVIWINPRVRAAGFEPLVGTMAAALPFCDELLPADDFRSLAAVVAEVSRSVRPWT
jgi:uncharacterized protein with von Willebrand factor type A (vWA) domain